MFYILLFTLVSGALSYSISLDSGNKFQNMLVFINDDVPEGDGALIENIKNNLDSASKSLLFSTNNLNPQKGGVQFGTVYIRVPESWKINSTYVTWQHCTNAIFFIAKSKSLNEKPYTKQLGKCGSPGNYTRFPHSYFKSGTQTEKLQASKEIMNEFVKLRYGVFTEKPIGNILMVFNGTDFVDAVCGKGVQWEVNVNKMQCTMPNKNCKYLVSQNQNYNHSVMFDTTMDKNVFYCDKKTRTHNHYAKNLQNMICNGQSVSEVILQHPDFKQNNSQRNFENVKFVIVKGQSRKIVFVLDVSGSMSNIIQNLRLATTEYIKNVTESISVGIVSFSNTATVVADLYPLNNQSNRELIISRIQNLQAYGWTNIPDGLRKGVEVLGGLLDNDNPVFGTIILLTDGDNNREIDRYDYVIDQIIKKGIVVNAISYGTSGDQKIVRLTQGTGGKNFYSKADEYSDLLEKFSVKESCYVSTDQEIKVKEGNLSVSITGNVEYRNFTYIDEFVGMNMTIRITVSITLLKYNITILSPNNKPFTNTSEIIQGQSVTRTYFISGKIETGFYRLEIKSSESSRFKRATTDSYMAYSISSKPQASGQRVIIPTGDLSISQIESLTSTTTVIVTVDVSTCGILESETVKVVLKVVSQNNRVITRNMRDDGLGDDIIAGDNIFTATLYPKDLQEEGFYDTGATVNISSTKGNDPIIRSVEIGSLRVIKVDSDSKIDKIPPAKIKDFKLSVPDPKKKVLNVQFLAPGNDGMIGNISIYRVNINSNVTKEISASIPPGENVELSVDLSNNTVSNVFTVTVQGVDDNGNVGEWSPSQIYNWKYQDIYDKYYKDNDRSNSGRLFASVTLIFVCLCVLFK